jgi:hypothetical protein
MGRAGCESPSEGARAEEVVPRGTGRQGDVTARMMLRLWD